MVCRVVGCVPRAPYSPQLPPTAKSTPHAYYALGDDAFLQSRAALEMRTRSFTLAHGGYEGKYTAGTDQALNRKMDSVSRYYENLASKQVPQLLRDRCAGLEMTTT